VKKTRHAPQDCKLSFNEGAIPADDAMRQARERIRRIIEERYIPGTQYGFIENVKKTRQAPQDSPEFRGQHI